jgi:hypothetical protein
MPRDVYSEDESEKICNRCYGSQTPTNSMTDCESTPRMVSRTHAAPKKPSKTDCQQMSPQTINDLRTRSVSRSHRSGGI